VDHLSQVPAKATFIFEFNPTEAIRTEGVRQVLEEDGAEEVVRALNDELSHPDIDVQRDWKEIVGAVKAKTKKKGKQLFHPIRVALTGSDSGPELEKLLPLFERGSRLELGKRVMNCQERVSSFTVALDARH
jgi:nondiscriminating glutamyl-tRNA synthetase